MKDKLCLLTAGAVGAGISNMFGGWNSAMTTLLIFMCADYATGIIVAVCGKSQKSKNGGLSSKIGLIGLAKKFMIMLMLLVACRLDILIGTSYIKDLACIAFILNELISITENVGLFIELPEVFKKAIDILKTKTEENKMPESKHENEESKKSESVQKKEG